METKEKNKTREIDVIASLQIILKEKMLLVQYLAIFAFIGVIVALNTPKKYTTTIVLAPEMTSGGMGMSETLKDMASSFGLNFGGGATSVDAIYPEIYPELFASTDFIMTFFDIPVWTKEDSVKKTFYQHIRDDKKVPFWAYPKVWICSLLPPKKESSLPSGVEGPFGLTREQNNICESIKNSLSCLIDKKTSVITISTTDEDPIVCTIVADTLLKRLKDYIISYRTQKARNDLKYALNLYNEAKQEYQKAQARYASFADSNESPVLKSVISKENELENEMQLKYNIYSQMVTQVQGAKAKVQERTPAFTVIQKASVPLRPSSTPRLYIVILFMFLGGLADALWVLFGRDYIKKK
ncbi:MAG: chain-length determining protein [Prevotella sp.]|nr:chain-length determining protein [Prevotella sp.]